MPSVNGLALLLLAIGLLAFIKQLCLLILPLMKNYTEQQDHFLSQRKRINHVPCILCIK